MSRKKPAKLEWEKGEMGSGNDSAGAEKPWKDVGARQRATKDQQFNQPLYVRVPDMIRGRNPEIE